MSDNGEDSAASETENGHDTHDSAGATADEDGPESSRIPVAEELQDLPTGESPDDDKADREDDESLDEELDPFETEAFAEREGDPFDDDLFQEVETSAIDEERIWEQLTAERDGETTPTDRDVAFSEIATDELEETVTVPKSSFCQSCEHFETPPEAECAHPGTRIVEFVGMERVRVHNCPVVQQERELGRSLDDDSNE